jgi:hypothetical protein
MGRNRRKDEDDVSLASEDAVAEETTAAEEPAAEEDPPAVLEAAVEEPEAQAPVMAEAAPEAPAEAPPVKGPTAGIQPGQYIHRGNLKIRVLAVVGENQVRGVAANSGKIITIDL